MDYSALVCVCMHFVLLTTIHKAIETGDQSIMKKWIQKNRTRVNEYKGGNNSHQHFAVANGTALHWAVYFGQLEIAQLLLENGAGELASLPGLGMRLLYIANLLTIRHSKLVCCSGLWE